MVISAWLKHFANAYLIKAIPCQLLGMPAWIVNRVATQFILCARQVDSLVNSHCQLLRGQRLCWFVLTELRAARVATMNGRAAARGAGQHA